MFADGSQVANGQYNQPGTRVDPRRRVVQSESSRPKTLSRVIPVATSPEHRHRNRRYQHHQRRLGRFHRHHPVGRFRGRRKIVTNSYDAEDGRFTGAQVQITSKSGSNDFHGSLFFHHPPTNLNAFQPYFGQPKVPHLGTIVSSISSAAASAAPSGRIRSRLLQLRDDTRTPCLSDGHRVVRHSGVRRPRARPAASRPVCCFPRQRCNRNPHWRR